MAGIDYTIVSAPKYVRFECPHCEEEVKQYFEDIDFNTDCWQDGAKATCDCCGEEVELGDYDYD